MIPESTIEEILSRIDIVELISDYIPLKRLGKNYKALCPFHHEKTPSFVVSAERQIFHCFGCSAGGNAIGFLMQYERLQFPEAVQMLAKKAGVVIPKSQFSQNDNQGENLQLYAVNEAAASFYLYQLNSPEAEAALAYLGQRGITRETIQKFKIGYAPKQRDGLLTHLRNKKFTLEFIEKAGLIIPKNGAGYYDRFRKRIVIPIIDTKERVVAFGGRVFPGQNSAENEETAPKYINSPETSIYTKGKVLFGLASSAQVIRSCDLVVIVEGYFDLIMPYQAGVKNIVASCGTALTIEQIRLLKRYSRNAVMVFDADNAGQMATLRSLGDLVEEGIDVRVARLPKGHDPDTFIRNFGVEKFQELIARAQDIFEYKLGVLKSQYNLSRVSDKAKIASEMLPLIVKFENQILQSAYIKKLAEELKVDEAHLRAELRKTKPGGQTTSLQAPVALRPLLNSYATERLLVKLMLEEQEIIERLRGRIVPSDFQDKHLSQIVSRIFELFNEGRKIDTSRLMHQCSDSMVSKLICELSTCEGPLITDKHKLLNDCINRLKEDARKLKQQEIAEQIKLAQIDKNENQLRELLAEFQSLSKRGV
jgi:DNA primase